MQVLLEDDVEEDTNKPKTLTLSQLRAGVSQNDLQQSQDAKKAETEAKKSTQQKFLDSIQPKLKHIFPGFKNIFFVQYLRLPPNFSLQYFVEHLRARLQLLHQVLINSLIF